MRKEVTIIGAGVIGLTLAKELASNGIDTKVYDLKESVSESASKASGILSISGLESAGIPYRSSIINELDGAVLHAGKEALTIKAKSAKAYVIDRRILADSCLKAAKSAGAEILLGKKMGREDLLLLEKDKNNIIVGADGAVSMVASAFGFPAIEEYVLTYKADYDNAHIDDKRIVNLFFSNKVANRFFGWAVPHSNRVLEVGLGVSSNAKTNSSATFNRFVDSGVLGTSLEDAKKTNGYASLIPLSCRRSTVKGNVLLVGDAAGQVKATTGGGIIFGSLCARVLAKAVLNNVNRESPLSDYEKMWRKQYGRELRMHRLLHGYYSSLDTKGFETLFKLSRLFGAEDFFSKYGDMDRPGLMLKRLFLRGLAK